MEKTILMSYHQKNWPTGPNPHDLKLINRKEKNEEQTTDDKYNERILKKKRKRKIIKTS